MNLHNASGAARMAIALGAEKGSPYAWQIKIPDREKILQRMTLVLDRRIQNSVFRNYAGALRLEFFQESIDIQWDAGRICSPPCEWDTEPGRNCNSTDRTFFRPINMSG